MPTLNINGKRIKVDDSFLKLSPEQQNAAVEEIASNIPGEASPDAFRPESFEQHEAPAYQGNRMTAMTEGSQAGLMGGFDDEIFAGGVAPFKAVADWIGGDGFDIGRAYDQLYANETERKDARRAAYPVSGTIGEIAGGLALGAGAAKSGLTMAGRNVPRLLGGKTGAAAAEGAGYGAIYGAGEAKPGERLEGAGIGAATGAAFGAGLEGTGRYFARRAASKAAPQAQTSADLADASRDLYTKADQSGAIISPKASTRLVANAKLAAGRVNERLHPKTLGMVERLSHYDGRPLKLGEFDELRREIGDVIARAEPQDARLLQRMKSVLDGFADNAAPTDLVAGSIDGFELLKQGRELWARKSKTQLLEDMVEQAKNQATGFENGLVIKFRQLANNKDALSKFTSQEQAMIKEVARRASGRGILRAIGMLSPTSTFGGIVTGGVGVGSGLIPGAALAGAGMAARAGAGALTQAKVNAVQRAVSSGFVPIPGLNKVTPLLPGTIEASRGVLPSGGTGR